VPLNIMELSSILKYEQEDETLQDSGLLVTLMILDFMHLEADNNDGTSSLWSVDSFERKKNNEQSSSNAGGHLEVTSIYRSLGIE